MDLLLIPGHTGSWLSLGELWNPRADQQTCTSSSVFHGGRVGNLAMWDTEALGQQDSCLCSNLSRSITPNPAPVPYLRSMVGQSHGKLQRKIKRKHLLLGHWVIWKWEGSAHSMHHGLQEIVVPVLCCEWEDIFQPCRHWISQCSLFDNIYTWKEESIISSRLGILAK